MLAKIKKKRYHNKMIILFLHRSFPGQFKHIVKEFAKDKNNTVFFITSAENNNEIPNVKTLSYSLPENNYNCHLFLKQTEECILHGQYVENIAIDLKKQGIIPDIIIGFSWGSPLFIKEVFPDVPFLCYFEWFNKTKNSLVDFHTTPSATRKAEIKCSNINSLIDLQDCDAGISPTNWQKAQFPKEYRNKIKVIHDGIDTDVCKPQNDVKIFFKDENLTLTAKDEVITYATRVLDPFRGFPQFMEAVEKLLVKRPNAHFIIAGDEKTWYGPPLKEGTYKEMLLNKLNLDMKRVHFTGHLPFDSYLKILQISSAHVYLTYPFFLSWSLLEAMAVQCCVIASNTEPVLEVIKDNKNGLLTDLFDTNQLVEKIEYALDNKDKMEKIRQQARKTILDKYDLEILLPKQIEYIKSLIKK